MPLSRARIFRFCINITTGESKMASIRLGTLNSPTDSRSSANNNYTGADLLFQANVYGNPFWPDTMKVLFRYQHVETTDQPRYLHKINWRVFLTVFEIKRIALRSSSDFGFFIPLSCHSSIFFLPVYTFLS